jgi:hypothetical protein
MAGAGDGSGLYSQQYILSRPSHTRSFPEHAVAAAAAA